jgi:3-hydroxybutyryl-CoA dehydrogenase
MNAPDPDSSAAPGSCLVVGAGTMGAGIAQVLLSAGAEVVLVDRDGELLTAVVERIRAGLTRQWRDQDDGGLVEIAMSRLDTRIDVPQRHDLDLVVEAIPENPDLKKRVLREIEERVGPDTLIGSNTSSLSISALAAVLAEPSRFIGMHFFNPVPKSDLLELVVGSATSTPAVERAQQWAARLEKTSIVVNDSPGFATSRLGLALGLEAIRMLEEGVASAEDIDTGMTLGYKHPMGPLRLTDLVGLDVRLAIAEHLAATLGPRFEPPQLLRQMVADGHLGKKSGKGFYEWA